MGLVMKFRSTTIATAAATAFVALSGVASAAGPVADAGSAISPDQCNLVVAQNGSDSNPGTVDAPLATSNAAVAALRPGQTLCFRDGTYQTTTGLSIRAANTITTSYPGEHATLLGSLRIERPATGAVVENLKLDGRTPTTTSTRSSTPTTRSCATTRSPMSTPPTACISRITTTIRLAANVVIENNNIHDCGVLPALNHQHGIYVAAARNLIIRDNLIWNNADRGIQLYTDVKGTEIYGNVINNNGVGIIISGADGQTTSDTLVEHNLITNSNIRHNLESWYDGGRPPAPPTSSNTTASTAPRATTRVATAPASATRSASRPATTSLRPL